MNITDLCAIDPSFRQWRKAVTLSASIKRRCDYYNRSGDPHYTLAVQGEAARTRAALQSYITDGEINSLLSSRDILKQPVKTTLANIFKLCRPPTKADLTELERTVTTQMNYVGRQSRIAQARSLLAFDIAYFGRIWPMVFDTLTVAPAYYTHVFKKGSTAFKDYIRRAAALAPEHRYLAVVEEGGTTNRLHIHVVHMWSALPAGHRDPNKGIGEPRRRELDCMKRLWRFGFSTPIIVRYSPNDPWGRANYRWPLDRKTNAPMRIGSPLRLANYLTKYLTKSYFSTRRSKHLWRIRKTQSLGRPILELLLSTSTPENLLAIASTRHNLRLRNMPVPPNQLRKTALRMLQRSRYFEKNGTSLTNTGTNIVPGLSPLQHLRASTLATTISNLPNSQNMRTLSLNDAAISEAVRALTIRAKELEALYFPTSHGTYGSYTSRDTIRQ